MATKKLETYVIGASQVGGSREVMVRVYATNPNDLPAGCAKKVETGPYEDYWSQLVPLSLVLRHKETGRWEASEEKVAIWGTCRLLDIPTDEYPDEHDEVVWWDE